MIPVVTVIGIIFSLLLSGSVVIETVFSVPGIGSLLGTAILRRDYPVIQGGLLLSATTLLLLNLLVDLLYAYFDPRVRYDVAAERRRRSRRRRWRAGSGALADAPAPACATAAFMIGSVLFGFVARAGAARRRDRAADPARISIRNRFKPPSFEHPLGTDNLGRSQLSRVVYGARLSLAIGFAVVVLNAVFGVMLGAAAGYFRRLDNVLMRIATR